MLLSLLFFLLQVDPIINEDQYENEALINFGIIAIFVFVLFVIVIVIAKFAFGGKQKEVIKEVHVKEIKNSNPPTHRTHCGQCGAHLDKDTPFCPYCGAQL